MNNGNVTDHEGKSLKGQKPSSRNLVIGLGGLVLAVILFYVEENFRHWLAWRSYRHAAGLNENPLDWKARLPKPLPEGENFAAAPLLQAIGAKGQGHPEISGRLSLVPAGAYLADAFSGKPANLQGFIEELLARGYLDRNTNADIAQMALQGFRPVASDLSELRQASLRPHAQFPAQGEDPTSLSIPNFVAIRSLCQILCLRADAFLAAGQPEEALRDLRVVLRLGDILESSPTLVSAMIRVALYGSALGPLRDGLIEGKWSSTQLAELQGLLEQANLISNLAISLNSGERAAIHYLVEQAPEKLDDLFAPVGPNASVGQRLGAMLTQWAIWLAPRGWHYRLLMSYDREMREIVAAIHPEQRHIDMDHLQRASLHAQELAEQGGPFGWLAGKAIPNMTKAGATVARTQNMLHLAALACALERFKLDTGAYPVLLEELTPKYLPPASPVAVAVKEVTYRRDEQGKFHLSLKIRVESQSGEAAAQPELTWVN